MLFFLGISWDREFNAQELHHTTSPVEVTQLIEPKEEIQRRSVGEADELARTAGLLLENVRHEQNPKFQKSQFMGLMKQLRDGEVIVEGNKMVESDGRTTSQSQVDVKGKGRAIDNLPMSMSVGLSNVMTFQPGLSSQNQATSNQQEMKGIEEDANDAYFRQENAEFTRYWNDTQVKQEPAGTAETLS